jgi:hypothetical protein
MRGGVIVRIIMSASGWRVEMAWCMGIERSIGSREVVKRREVKIDEGLVLEDI